MPQDTGCNSPLLASLSSFDEMSLTSGNTRDPVSLHITWLKPSKDSALRLILPIGSVSGLHEEDRNVSDTIG